MDRATYENPFDFFDDCFQKAKVQNLPQHDAMVLITATPEAKPSGRMVLLKGVTKGRDFRFFTNYESRKAGELFANSQAQLLFYWPALGRQIRVEGKVEKLSDADSDAYWQTRGRGSQVGGMTSLQSRPLDAYEKLSGIVEKKTREWDGKEIPRPESWGGFALIVDYFEFWEDRADRLHERITYQRSGEGWVTGRLWP